MGTPDIAAVCLEKLIDSGHEVCGVFTQMDKPKGRHGTLSAPPVKELAVKKGIPVFQPRSMRDGEALSILGELKPSLIIVVAYGKILPPEILNLPELGCINIHASLLPLLRGAAPVQWAVINGFTHTGVTSMMMDEGIDTGDILLSKSTKILPDETGGELLERLAPLGAEVLLETIDALNKGTLTRVKQSDSEATYAPILTRETGVINWNEDALTVHNKIRGLQPWPGASTVLAGKDIKILKSAYCECKAESSEAGKIISANKRLTVVCGDGKCVDILELQAQGKKSMPVKDYLIGNPVQEGCFMGVK